MTHRQRHTSGGDGSQPAAPPDISRRKVMAAGVVGGLGIAAASAPVRAAETATAPARGVGTGRPGTTTVEFRGRIEQSGDSGQRFSAYGFLIRATGARSGDLFAGSPHDASTALLTIAAAGDLSARVLDMSVHSLDIVGTLAVHQRRHPGADFADPSSFSAGTVIARFDLRLQDVLAVFAPAHGIPTLTGDMTQTAARRLGGPLAGKTFGATGSRSRLFATGLGTLEDPVTLNALLEVAGHWSAG
jgi:hypothetical protein